MNNREQKQKAYQYMKGWSAAAGFTGIPKEDQEDKDFMAGYDDGRLARKAAHAQAETKYNIKWDIIRLV